MTEIVVAQVDERDGSWERSDPRFRVYLHGSGKTATGGWTATYDITGADVLQVVDWAQRQAGDALTYAVALVVDEEARERRSPGHGRGLVWLIGRDGNDSSSAQQDVEARRRMLVRRQEPVGIRAADQMPPGASSLSAERIDLLNRAQPPE